MDTTTLEGFSYHPWGDGVVFPADPHLLVVRLKIRDKLQYGIFEAGAWGMARKDGEVVLLDGLAHHRFI